MFTFVVRRIRRVRRVKKPTRAPEVASAHEAHYRAHRAEAHAQITARVAEIAARYDADYAGVTVRNQSTRWGSCSSKRRLNFSYKIIFLPPELFNYVIIHEVAHLFEMNHSPAFWRVVTQESPACRAHRRTLRGYRLSQLPHDWSNVA